MTIRNLDALLSPASVALVGASNHPGSVGHVVLENLLAAGFDGPIYAVNPHPLQQTGAIWSASVDALPEAPELAVIATPATTVPAIVDQLGRKGTKAVVVITGGVTAADGLRQAMLDAARPHMLRIVGPNCIGALMPHARLNASFANAMPKTGRLAMISQSGALVTAMLDWASTRGIGFSGIVSAGDMADVDLGDLIDLFAADPHTDAILMYVEGVTNAAKFMSAARAASRAKPIVAIKAGRNAASGKAALSHTGALAGAYDVYQAAFHRAGIVMVDTLEELFDAAEVLRATKLPDGDRLGIVTNGGGAGVLAADAIDGTGGALATLIPATIATLDKILPPSWSRANPVDIIGDAHADRYRAACKAMLDAPEVDALLVMNCPTALAAPDEAARAVQSVVEGAAKPVLACWLGDANAATVRDIICTADIPLFSTPHEAVRAFAHLLIAKRSRDALTNPSESKPGSGRQAVSAILAGARREGRTVLDEVEAKSVLSTYGIKTVPTRFAATTDDIDAICGAIDGPYAVKIVSPQISHKSDAGGVALHLSDVASVKAAAGEMRDRIAREHPSADIKGFAVELMCIRPGAYELLAGIADDPTFGPLIMVGAGGKAVEVLGDKALELVPLGAGMAKAMIGKTRIARLLAGYRDEPPADTDAVAQTLEALSQIAVDLPDIAELDINPLLVDRDGVIALDARIRITADPTPASRLVIQPVPVEWAADLVTRDGLRFHVRPVRPDDEKRLAEHFAHVSPEDLDFRFLSGIRRVDHARLMAMLQIDYQRKMLFLALDEGGSVIATAEIAADPDGERAEIALSTRSDVKGRGVSWTLFEHVLRYAKARGITRIETVESAANASALQIEREMGFIVRSCPGDPTTRIASKILTEAA